MAVTKDGTNPPIGDDQGLEKAEVSAAPEADSATPESESAAPEADAAASGEVEVAVEADADTGD